LEAMIRFDEQGTWDFPNGADYLGHFIRLIEQCGKRVLAKIRFPLDDQPDWNPVFLTVQVLAILAVLEGCSIEDVGQAFSLFSNPQIVQASVRSKKWRELREALGNYRSELIDLLLAYTGCTKGGGDVQYVDASQILPALTALKKMDWELTAKVGDIQDTRFDKLRRAWTSIQKTYEDAIAEEREAGVDWADRVVKLLGEPANFRQLVHAIRSARDLALKAGALPQVYRQPDFDAAVKAFETASLKEALEVAQSAQVQKSRQRLLSLLAQDHGEAITATTRFMDEVGPVLEGVIKRLKSDLSAITSGADANLSQMRTDITDALDSIAKDLTKLSGGS